MLTLQLASHTGKGTDISKDNQSKPFSVLKQIYTSQPFCPYLGNGWQASVMSQSFESTGTETKLQKKGKRSLRQDFDSCSTWQRLQYQDTSKMECPSILSTPYASTQKKNDWYRVRAYGKKNFISHKSHFQAIIHKQVLSNEEESRV